MQLSNTSTAHNEIAVKNYFWQIVFSNLSFAKKDLPLKLLSKTIRFIASIQGASTKAVLHLIDKDKLTPDILNQWEILEKQINEEYSDENNLGTANPSANLNKDERDLIKNEKSTFLPEEIKTSV